MPRGSTVRSTPVWWASCIQQCHRLNQVRTNLEDTSVLVLTSLMMCSRTSTRSMELLQRNLGHPAWRALRWSYHECAFTSSTLGELDCVINPCSVLAGTRRIRLRSWWLTGHHLTRIFSKVPEFRARPIKRDKAVSFWSNYINFIHCLTVQITILFRISDRSFSRQQQS